MVRIKVQISKRLDLPFGGRASHTDVVKAIAAHVSNGDVSFVDSVAGGSADEHACILLAQDPIVKRLLKICVRTTSRSSEKWLMR